MQKRRVETQFQTKNRCWVFLRHV